MSGIIGILLVIAVLTIFCFALPVIAVILAVRTRRATQLELCALSMRLEKLEGERDHVQETVAAPKIIATAPTLEAPAPSEAPRRRGTSFEETIGLVWFTRLGAVIGILVVAWFFKLAIDREWIGPFGRVGVGALLGAALLATGSRLARRRAELRPYFAHGVMGLGLAVLIVTVFAAFSFYQILSLALALVLIALLCALGGVLAHMHGSQLLLALSLLAALLNPVLLASGSDRPLALFAYLLTMAGSALFLAIAHNYKVVVGLAVFGIIALFTSWHSSYFDVSPPPPPGLLDELLQDLQGAYFKLAARVIPLLFAGLFAVLFGSAGVFARRRARALISLILLIVATIFAHVAAAALLYDHPLILGGVLLGLVLASGALLLRTDHDAWLGLPMLVSFSMLAIVTWEADAAARLDPVLLGEIGLWLLLNLAIMARGPSRRRVSPEAVHLATMANTGIVFLVLLFLSTPASAPTARAAGAFFAGLLYLVIGLRIAPLKASLPFGLAATFFVIALALLLTGPSITIAWALAAAVLAWLARNSRDGERTGRPFFVALTLLLFAATFVRFVACDLDWPEAQRTLFIATAGVHGALAPTPFLNPRGLAILTLGLALLGCARLFAPLRARLSFRTGAVLTLIAGHLALLAMFIMELRLVVQASPPLVTAGMPPEKLDLLLAAWHQKLAALGPFEIMVTTIVIGIYAIGLLIVGFLLKERLYRLLGIVLLCLATAKLALFDVWSLKTIARIAVGATLAAALLIGGYLYARFAARRPIS